PEKVYKLCLVGYHLKNCKAYLDITEDELREDGPWKVVSTSIRDVMEEWLKAHQNASRKIEGRLIFF
ncbi:MAG: bifunctional metallophosphatase/5'-nucleotidase, partial [archaeon]